MLRDSGGVDSSQLLPAEAPREGTAARLTVRAAANKSFETIPWSISGPGLQIRAGKQTMPKSGGSKHTEAGAGGAAGQRKRRAEEDTGSSSSSSSSGGAVKIEGGQRKRRAGGGEGQELPGGVMVMAAADDVVLVEQGHGAHAILQLGSHEVALSDLWCVSFFDVVFV